MQLIFSDHGTYILFDVVNTAREKVAMDTVFAAGGSTKDGHEGLGVPTVQWLAESVPGGSVIADINESIFHVQVRLPRRVL